MTGVQTCALPIFTVQAVPSGSFTADKDALKAAIAKTDAAGPDGGTDIRTAVHVAAAALPDDDVKAAIILLTDGQDNAKYDPTELGAAAQAAGAALFAIGLGPGVNGPFLEAAVTPDGKYFFLDDADGAEAIYDAIFNVTNFRTWRECSAGHWVDRDNGCL